MTKDKLSRGISYFWGGLNSISGGGVRFVFVALLARILSPEDFGIIAIISSILWITDNIVDGGFSTSLIQKMETFDEDYQTAYSVSLITSIVIFLLLNGFAQTLTRFLDLPELLQFIRVSSIIPVIGALGIVHKSILIKSIDFKKLTLIGFVSNTLSGLLALILAFQGYGIWSFIYLLISFKVFESIMLNKLVLWKPKLKFYKQNFKELFSFGSSMLFSSTLNSIFFNLYPLLIGKMYHPITLGYYSQASRIKSIFSTDIISVIDRVTFPILSKIQDDNSKLKDTLKQVLKITTTISFSISFFIIGAADNLIISILGEQWTNSTNYLQIISIEGIIFPFQILNLKILLVKGKSKKFLQLEVIKKVLITINLLTGYYFGIYALLWGTVVIAVISFFLNSFYSRILIDYSGIQQIKDCFKPFLIGLTIGLIAMSFSLLEFNKLVIFIIQIVIAFYFFILLNKKVQSKEHQIFVNFIKKYI